MIPKCAINSVLITTVLHFLNIYLSAYLPVVQIYPCQFQSCLSKSVSGKLCTNNTMIRVEFVKIYTNIIDQSPLFPIKRRIFNKNIPRHTNILTALFCTIRAAISGRSGICLKLSIESDPDYLITSLPPMYGLRASGITTLPSSCW